VQPLEREIGMRAVPVAIDETGFRRRIEFFKKRARCGGG
jgi:hypothetical protein